MNCTVLLQYSACGSTKIRNLTLDYRDIIVGAKMNFHDNFYNVYMKGKQQKTRIIFLS